MDIQVVYVTLLVMVSVLVSVRPDDADCYMDNCYDTNEYYCNQAGTCECGTCVCEPPYHGPTCQECPTCPTPCEVFKGCVGCKIFGTGFMGVMECLTTCDYIAQYIEQDPADFDEGNENTTDATLCKHTNENMCVESFKVAGMSKGYRVIYVRTQVECVEVDMPTLAPWVPVEVEPGTTPDIDDTTTEYPSVTQPETTTQTMAREETTKTDVQSTKTKAQTKQQTTEQQTIPTTVTARPPKKHHKTKPKPTTDNPIVTDFGTQSSAPDVTTKSNMDDSANDKKNATKHHHHHNKHHHHKNKDGDKSTDKMNHAHHGKNHDNNKDNKNDKEEVIHIDIELDESDEMEDDGNPEVAGKAAGSSDPSSGTIPLVGSVKTIVLVVLSSFNIAFLV